MSKWPDTQCLKRIKSIMDHLRLQSAFKFVAISRFGDGGQLMTVANFCLEAVDQRIHNPDSSHIISESDYLDLADYGCEFQ